MARGNEIREKMDARAFLQIIEHYDEKQIIITDHTLFRLKEKERKLYKEEIIKELLTGEPKFVGIQHNGNHAIIYNYKRSLIKIILNIEPTKMNVVTFYIVQEIPKLK